MYEFGLLSDQKPHFTFSFLLSFNPINLAVVLVIYSLFLSWFTTSVDVINLCYVFGRNSIFKSYSVWTLSLIAYRSIWFYIMNLIVTLLVMHDMIFIYF